MNEKYPFLEGNYDDLPLDSDERPIRVLDTVTAGVPEPSKRFLDHMVDRVAFPNGNEGYHHRLVIPPGVMLAHVDDQETVALVKNYRHALGRDSVELPSGAVDLGLDSLTAIMNPEDAERIAGIAQAEGVSILDLLGADQLEDLLKLAAARETREEIGINLDPRDLVRLIPGPLRGSVGYAGQTYNIFYGQGGTPTVESHDNGEAGILKHGRVPIGDAAEMVGNKIVDPATAAAINSLALIYGIKPSWLPKRHSR